MNDTWVGKQFGNYRIEEVIGKGAMAEVYRAFHPNLNRHVAIKRLRSFLAEQTDMLDRFQREAQNIAGMDHPNIVKVYDFDKLDSMYYMVMEFIDGEPLKDVLKQFEKKDESLPILEAVQIGRDVGDALAYAHAREIVHRDIKPANVMLERSGRIVLTDFGLARLLSGPQFTSTGTIVGTPSYMSPEQGTGNTGDARSDIYSLGAMLYELLTGDPPFSGETPIAVIYKHINAPVPPIRELNPNIPEGLEQVILRAMAKKPEARYANAGEMVEDLEILRDALFSDSDSPAAPVETPERRPVTGLRVNLVEDGTSYELTGKDRYIFGRLDGAFQPDIDFGKLEGAQSGVSRLHAEVEVTEGGEVFISDLESTNGTWVNGQRVSSEEHCKLFHGDVVRIGRSTLQIVFLR